MAPGTTVSREIEHNPYYRLGRCMARIHEMERVRDSDLDEYRMEYGHGDTVEKMFQSYRQELLDESARS